MVGAHVHQVLMVPLLVVLLQTREVGSFRPVTFPSRHDPRGSFARCYASGSGHHWSQEASFEFLDQNNNTQRKPILKNNPDSLTSPRPWLEHYPDGVYTVLRADLLCAAPASRSSFAVPWRVWGVDFHLERLRESYRQIYLGNDNQKSALLDKAVADSVLLAGSLLANAFWEIQNSTDLSCQTESCTVVVMLTLLWYPQNDDNDAIRVLAHGFSTGQSVDPRRHVAEPVNVAIASENTPNRTYFYPQAKQSSWCTVRRPLETKYKKMNNDIGEVLLVDRQGGVTSVLEVRYGCGPLLLTVFATLILCASPHRA